MKRNKSFLLYWLVLIFGLSFFSDAMAQRNHFVYLQTDEQLPFYVVHKGKNYSSSGIGYLILPKLADSTYSIKLGFPGVKEVENFDLVLNGNDQGFLVKKFPEKGWGLFNLQTMDVQISGVEMGKRSQTIAALKAAAEKRAADSIAAIAAAQEAQRVADSVAIALAAAEEIRLQDSVKNAISMKEQQAKDDSLALVAAAQTKAEKELAEQAAIKEAAQLAEAKALQDSLTKRSEAIAEKEQKEKEAAAKKKELEEIAAEKKKAAEREKAAESALPDPKVPGAPEMHQLAPDTVVTAKPVKEAVKEPVEKTDKTTRKLGEQALDSGLAMVYKDGADTVKAFIPTTRPADVSGMEEDTITIRIPAKPIAKKLEPIKETEPLVAEPAVETEKPVISKTRKKEKPEDSRFLDMEINSDTTGFVKAPEIVKEEKPRPTVQTDGDSPKKEKGESKKSKKPGLVSNNENTRIIEPEPVEITPDLTEEKQEISKEKQDLPKEKKASKKTAAAEKEKNKPGLVANNEHTKIVEDENTEPDEEKKIVKKEERKKAQPDEKAVSKKAENKKDEEEVQPKANNAQCKQVAASKDFFALRKKMAAADDADEMIGIARKAFKTHCYTIFQLRNLSVLFLTDAERYSFLDAAYPFAADDHLYGELSDLLTETYYLNRFKAMLR